MLDFWPLEKKFDKGGTREKELIWSFAPKNRDLSYNHIQVVKWTIYSSKSTSN